MGPRLSRKRAAGLLPAASTDFDACQRLAQRLFEHEKQPPRGNWWQPSCLATRTGAGKARFPRDRLLPYEMEVGKEGARAAITRAAPCRLPAAPCPLPAARCFLPLSRLPPAPPTSAGGRPRSGPPAGLRHASATVGGWKRPRAGSEPPSASVPPGKRRAGPRPCRSPASTR